MSKVKESTRKLESLNRQNKDSDDQVVRKGVVAQRKKELARTISDLDDMLQGLHADNDFHIKRCKIEAEEEKVQEVALSELQIKVKELLATNPESCTDNQMASLAAKIEGTRRAILRIQLGKGAKIGKTSTDSLPTVERFLLLSGWQKYKLALILSLPVVITLIFGFILIAFVLGIVFGG